MNGSLCRNNRGCKLLSADLPGRIFFIIHKAVDKNVKCSSSSGCPEGMGLRSRVHASERRNVPGCDAWGQRCLARHLVLCGSMWLVVKQGKLVCATRCLSDTVMVSI